MVSHLKANWRQVQKKEAMVAAKGHCLKHQTQQCFYWLHIHVYCAENIKIEWKAVMEFLLTCFNQIMQQLKNIKYSKCC